MAQGSVKEQLHPTLQPFIGTRSAEAVWQWGRIKSLARGLNPVETTWAKGGRRGTVGVSLCVCVDRVGARETVTWMGKPELMLECVC